MNNLNYFKQVHWTLLTTLHLVLMTMFLSPVDIIV